jgi:PRTRC genetic system ThiF family protein
MEPIVHRLKNPRALTRLAVIGCGGTGAPLIGGLPYLDQSLRATGHPGLQVVVVDGDKVSPINCVRQPFSESEIGLHKSVVLVNRLNLFWNLRWQASTEYVTRSTQGKIDIIISCVDTRAARREIVKSPLMKECMYWLDIGNNADSGQFILGQPKNSRNRRLKQRLPVVSELFPEIVTPNPAASDDLPSCSAVEALERQEPFINQTLAYQALALLARLFRHGQLTHHGAFLDIRNGRMTPLGVNPEVWHRMMMKPARISNLVPKPPTIKSREIF